jgi:Haem-binding domain
MKKKIAYALLFILIIIQFFRPAKNINAAASANANDISKIYIVPENVQSILKTSCYDCHSNNTYYPWYNNIQPVAWWLNHHVEEGKREINFNEFASYQIRRQYKKMEEVIDQVKEDEMPLSSYTIIHTDAKLSPEQKLELNNWADGIRKNMEAKYPPDSLKRK